MPATSSPAVGMRYRDVGAASDWLCAAFGFERQTVMADEAGATVYAQLTLGRAMVMLGGVRDTPLDKLMKQPDEIGGAETQSCYLVVADADAHHAQAKAAGAEVLLDLQDDDFGGRVYTCRDPEGHIWTFGTYDPWQGNQPQPAAVTAARAGLRPVVVAGLAMTMVAAAMAAAWIGGVLRQPSAVSSTIQVQEPTAQDKTAAEARERAVAAAEQAARELRGQLDRERIAKAATDRAGEEALKRLAAEQLAREAAERASREARVEVERERAAKDSAEKAGVAATARAAEEKGAREAAERAARELRRELERERSARLAAEMAKDFALGRADEERLAREEAERASEEARKGPDREPAAKAPEEPAVRAPAEAAVKLPAALADTDALKRAAELERALEQAKKRAADAERTAVDAHKAKKAADQAAEGAQELLARERLAKTAAWKAAAQLRRQLDQLKGATSPTEEATGADDNAGPAPAPKKARPRPRLKKAPQPDPGD